MSYIIYKYVKLVVHKGTLGMGILKKLDDAPLQTDFNIMKLEDNDMNQTNFSIDLSVLMKHYSNGSDSTLQHLLQDIVNYFKLYINPNQNDTYSRNWSWFSNNILNR